MNQSRRTDNHIAGTRIFVQILCQVALMQLVIDILPSRLGQHRLRHIHTNQVTGFRTKQLAYETGSTAGIDYCIGAMARSRKRAPQRRADGPDSRSLLRRRCPTHPPAMCIAGKFVGR